VSEIWVKPRSFKEAEMAIQKVPDLSVESDYLAHITKVLLHLKKYIEEHPSTYIPVMRAYSVILVGVTVTIKVSNCDEDPNCEIEGGVHGGILDSFEAIDEAMEALDLELDFQSPSYIVPGLYDI
jgi:hypothetical protein